MHFSRFAAWCYLLQPAAAASLASQHGIGQSSIGQGKSQQASVAEVPDWAVVQQSALDELANEKAMPAESRIAALSASALFFMM